VDVDHMQLGAFDKLSFKMDSDGLSEWVVV